MFFKINGNTCVFKRTSIIFYAYIDKMIIKGE